jgi:hypothetical protein
VRNPEIPWQKVAGIGNILRHNYESIAAPVLWKLCKPICRHWKKPAALNSPRKKVGSTADIWTRWGSATRRDVDLLDVRPAGRYLGEVGGVACDRPPDLFCLWDAAQPAWLVEIANPTCSESRVGFRQINALVEKLALHFLQSCCGPRLFPRESHLMNENHARFQTSMTKVGTTFQNRLQALSNCLI